MLKNLRRKWTPLLRRPLYLHSQVVVYYLKFQLDVRCNMFDCSRRIHTGNHSPIVTYSLHRGGERLGRFTRRETAEEHAENHVVLLAETEGCCCCRSSDSIRNWRSFASVSLFKGIDQHKSLVLNVVLSSVENDESIAAPQPAEQPKRRGRPPRNASTPITTEKEAEK